MRSLLFFMLATLSASAFSADYTWTISLGSTSFTNTSPAAVCLDYSKSLETETFSYTVGSVTRVSDAQFSCVPLRKRISTGTEQAGSPQPIYRNGTSCDGTYNAQTGECEKPPEPEPDLCAASAGSETPFSKSGKAGDGWYTQGANGIGATPDQACRLGCLTTLAKVKCTDTVDGSYQCGGWQYGAGVKCPNGTGGFDTEEGSQTPEPEPQTIVDKKPCVYETLANGTQQCKSESSVEQEGENCGSFNGEYKCLPKAPSKNGVEIATSVKTDPTADGGSKSTKTDVTSKTICKDGKCTTSTTTRTTITTKDANGNTTSVTGNCTGKDCKDQNESPDGTGNGGLCIGSDCSDNPFEGSGEGAGTGPDLEDVDGYGDTVSQYFGRITNSPIIASVSAISIPSGGSCPTFTETIPYVGTLSTSTVCQLASSILTPLRLIFLAIWGWAAIRVFMSA